MISFNRQSLLIFIVSIIFLLVPIIGSPELGNGQAIFSSVTFLRRFSGTLLVVFFFAINYFVLIPKYYIPKKFIWYFSFIALCFLLTMNLPRLIISDAQLIEILFKRNNAAFGKPPIQPALWQRIFLDKTFYEFIISVFTAILLRINIQMHIIEQEKLLSEVSYLKAQINPHFLFNTLNSLYALALEKSDDTPDTILKLSTIMRYVTIESSNEKVELQKEIEYIKNYIDLQRFRMDDSTDFSFSIKGEIQQQKIAPLVFIPFIENAFKYGLNPDKYSKILIAITIENKHAKLYVKNTKSVQIIKENEKSKTGLENTLKRLEYIYPNKHKLNIDETESFYTIQLTIDLA